MFLQVDGDGGDLVAGYEDLHRSLKAATASFSFLIAVSGTDAEEVGIEHEHQDLYQPCGGRPVAEDNHLAAVDHADLVHEMGEVREVGRAAADVVRFRLLVRWKSIFV